MTTATDDGTVQIRCYLCGAELGSLTVMSDDHEPLGPVHLGLTVDCCVCLRRALLFVRYEVASTPSR